MGRLVLLAFSFLASSLSFAQPSPQLCAAPAVYQPCDVVFELNDAERKAHPQPYRSVEMHAEFRSPRHRTLLLPAFWDGANRLVIRFTPTGPGEWVFRVTSNLERFTDQESKLTVAENDSPGFLRVANVHHWAYTERNIPHLWIGDTALDFLSLPDPAWRTLADARAEQKFTHLRFYALGSPNDPLKAFTDAATPNPAFFQRADERLRYLHSKGLTADLILGYGRDHLQTFFPDRQARERFVRYLAARYAGFNITWDLLENFEEYRNGRQFAKEIGLLVKQWDPYNHPRTTQALATSAPLLGDGWMHFVSYGSTSSDLGSVEHQLYPVPFVNRALGADNDPAAFRRRLWNATMDGQYPSASLPASSAGKEMAVWHTVISDARHWELEPYFDVSGGRAVALEGIEYIVYVEKPSGPVEVTIEKHGYDISWINPATGEVIPLKKFKAEQFVGEPPNRNQDWILHIEREGRKEGMLRSYKFESRPVPIQEVEVIPAKLPFQIALPEGNEISVSRPPKFAIKVTRQTRATRRFQVLWTGDVPTDGNGFRVLGTGPEGTLVIPADIATRLPAVLSLRVTALNANGKAYSIDRVYQLVP